jgi:hypothetical protein
MTEQEFLALDSKYRQASDEELEQAMATLLEFQKNLESDLSNLEKKSDLAADALNNQLFISKANNQKKFNRDEAENTKLDEDKLNNLENLLKN